MKIKLALIAATLFAAQAASAQTYVGVGVGQSKLKADAGDFLVKSTGSTFDDKDTAGKVFIGHNLTRNFALEGSYNYLGKFTATRAPFEYAGAQARSLGLDAVLTLPLTQRIAVFGKAGVERTRVSATYNRVEANDTSWNPKFGLGASLKLTPNVALRGEFERHRADFLGDKERVNTTSVSLVYSFGAKPAVVRAPVVAAPAPVYTAPAPTPAPAAEPAPAVEAPVVTTKKIRE